MREIKFRVWDGKRMLTPYEINFNRYGISVRCKEVVETIKNPILLQYTGLKDRKGKEIYEGDLIRVTKNTTKKFWKVKFGNWIVGEDDYYCDSHEVLGWYMERGTEQTNVFGEVIGNVHENPDLLRETI